MADFRKMLFVLAGLLIIVSTASAQTSCISFVASSPTLRQESAADPAADIILNCSGVPTSTQAAVPGNQQITLYLSQGTIASRQLVSTSSSPLWTEAALFINDGATSVGTSNVAQTAIQGAQQGSNALVFSGFAFPAGASSFTIRITNVRINATGIASGNFVNANLLANFPLQNGNSLLVGVVQASMNATVSTPITAFAQCTSAGTSPGSSLSNLTVTELVNTAFKDQGSAATNGIGVWYQNGTNTESQTVLSAAQQTGFVNTAGFTPGLADNPTRIRVNLAAIPAGVTVFLPTSIQNNTTTGQLLASAGGDTGGFTPASGQSLSGVSVPSGFTVSGSYIAIAGPGNGSVTYQIGKQNGGQLDKFTFPVVVQYTYAAPSTPAVGTVSVSATYAPTTAESSSAIPRFADTSVLNALFTISACQSNLLFSFLTNQAGFDTGIAIANTSLDPFTSNGSPITPAQNGTCALSWFGTGPAALTTTTTQAIPAGSVYTTLVSTSAAGFQGYMIAVCNFQYAHGFAFISDGYGQPGKGLSQGYLAQVIPNPSQNGATRAASDSSRSAANSGEGLGN